MSDLFNKLIEELNNSPEFEVINESIKVSVKDVRKIQKPSDGSGDSGSEPQDQSGDDSDGSGQEQGGDSGEGQQGSGQSSGGEQSSSDGEDGEGEGDGDLSDSSSGKPGQPSETNGLKTGGDEPDIPDSHDPIYKGGKGGGFRDMFKKVYKEAEKHARSPGSHGSGTGGILEKIQDFAYPPLDVNEIMKLLNNFKRLHGNTSEGLKKGDTYFVRNPANQPGTGMNLPGEHKIKKTPVPEQKSAIMFFAIDTSGSIGEEDFAAIKGYLKEITDRFSKKIAVKNSKGQKVADVTGEVYLVEWDTAIQLPIRKWTKITKKNGKYVVKPEVTDPKGLPKGKGKTGHNKGEDFEVRGHGGTDINAVFKQIDDIFLRNTSDQSSKGKFVLDDSEDFIATDRDRFRDKKDVVDSKLPPVHKTEVEVDFSEKARGEKNKKVRTVKPDEVDLTSGVVNITSARQNANIPFMIFYTDGWFAKANYKASKILRNNPGNILYILTDPSAVDNLTPKNVMYHDLTREHRKGQ